MNRAIAASVLVVIAVLALSLAWRSGQAGDKKEDAWKDFLPPQVYKELVSRELKTVQAGIESKDDMVIQKGKVAALMIASYTLTAKGGKEQELAAVRNAALNLAEIIGDQGKTLEATKLRDLIASSQGLPAGKYPDVNFRKIVPDDRPLMVMYMSKDKGGDGLHANLVISPRLKDSQEYIENLFSYLAKGKKNLLEKNITKPAAHELALAAYRTAVSAELIHAYTPKTKSKKRDPELWVKTAHAMRDSALDLADAAQKQDVDAIIKTSGTLLDSCVQCHKMFQ